MPLTEADEFVQKSGIKSFEPFWGEWRIIKLLGRGTYGRVYLAEKAEELGIGKRYYSAIKHLSIPPEGQEDYLFKTGITSKNAAEKYNKGLLENLLTEIDVNYQLKGYTNIVCYETHNIVTRPDGGGYDIFIKLEYLTSLIELSKSRALTLNEILSVGIDICTALTILRQRNIVHRDIKPENLFVNESGDFKLGDFGVAKVMENANSQMTVLGTYDYMAPEVYGKTPGDYRVDIYSLGMVLYRLLNGNRAPFVPPNPDYSDIDRSRARRMGGEELPPPAFADMPLSKIVLKACAFNPDDRWDNADEMEQALQKYRHALSPEELAKQTFTPGKEAAKAKQPSGTVALDIDEVRRREEILRQQELELKLKQERECEILRQQEQERQRELERQRDIELRQQLERQQKEAKQRARADAVIAAKALAKKLARPVAISVAVVAALAIIVFAAVRLISSADKPSDTTVPVTDTATEPTSTDTTITDTPTADIYDNAIRSAVARALGQSAGQPVSRDAVAELTELVITSNDGQVGSLEDLSLMPELAVLVLSGHDLSQVDCTPIAYQKKLQRLELAGCGLAGCGFIEELSGLVELDLSGNALTALPSLANLGRLEKINISGNPLTSVMELADAGALKNVEAAGLSLLDWDSISISVEVMGLELVGLVVDGPAVMKKGDSATLALVPAPSVLTGLEAVWSSSKASVVTVDETGAVTAVGTGKAVITVICGDISAVHNITVESATATNKPTTSPSTSTSPPETETAPTVSITGTNIVLSVGESLTFGYAITPSSPSASATWSSSNSEVATVDSNGKVTATGRGRVTITVTVNGGSASVTVVVS